MIKVESSLYVTDDISYTEINHSEKAIIIENREIEIVLHCNPSVAEKLARDLLESVRLYNEKRFRIKE
jgi:hypothetical protein